MLLKNLLENQKEFNVLSEFCIVHSYLQFFTVHTLKLEYFLKKTLSSYQQ